MQMNCAILCCSLILIQIKPSIAQNGLTQFDQFEIKNNDVVWQATYSAPGAHDSVRQAIVRMLKSKFYTFNVVRTSSGYNGELRHLKVDCKKYGRTYSNTPRLYWDGEWTGKFALELAGSAYQVTIYGLYFEKTQVASGYYKTEKQVKGRYIDVITVKNKSSFQKNELSNLSLMSKYLRDEFDLVHAKNPTD